ncbi:HlyD family secretion protein [Saccharicrinis carchari]|uniref:HlyD family secretion protein n=1 Tax=Saccharicrinis carchari TaxID=1168039 RepID=A0A521AW79_SACCC|nr:HlyD family efflux transporter periplasmic adaptor subunit [Saccharicrinis carchari]SMO39086.1 HlyD family secretion protein [Saccharicrinis carchari]
MKRPTLIFIILIAALFTGCKQEPTADAYGNFEATEITVSAKARGEIKYLNLEEGSLLQEKTVVGLIDTMTLYLNKMQLMAQKEVVRSKSGNVWSQMAVLQSQLKTAESELDRVQNMFDEEAATSRQLDRATSEVEVLQKKMDNVKSQNAPIMNEVLSIEARIAQIAHQIDESKITNPIKGTVLNQYAESGEISAFGKPLYKIANLEQMTLRVYINQTQLSQIEIGEKVNVSIDFGKDTKSYEGKISWISSAAEFTPKIIQTKEERVNLVYAMDIKVKNDGSLKIGMPGEVYFK